MHRHRVGLTDARQRFIVALEAEAFEHESRVALSEKNVLAVGDVTVAAVVELLKRCRGHEYSASPHHYEADVTVHEFRPTQAGVRWYIKGYLQRERLVVISVHRAERDG